jgi:mono/diheme cytochrome c family protein
MQVERHLRGDRDMRVVTPREIAAAAVVICFIVAAIADLGGRVAFAATGATVWDGVYTDAQAARGQAVYQKECATCHQDNLRGDGLAPGLIADAFAYRWQDDPVGDLFIVLKATMPADRPSSLRDKEYADIVAYLLKMNNYPAGHKDLSDDVADLQQITFKKP